MKFYILNLPYFESIIWGEGENNDEENILSGILYADDCNCDSCDSLFDNNCRD